MDNPNEPTGNDNLPNFGPGSEITKEEFDRLATLDSNLREIIDNLSKIHSPEYANAVAGFFTIIEQVQQLEDIACRSTRALNKIYAEAEDKEKTNKSYEDHTLVHMLSMGVLSKLREMGDNINIVHPNFNKDVEILLKRTDEDWHSKIERH